ncbi:MAG: hypothetical protein ABI664_04350 [bacterium]
MPAPQQPQVRVAPAVPGVNVITLASLTRQDIAALRARGEELSNQITSASGRRRQTREALRSATGADKTGLEQRLGVLDARIARLETDIDENGKLLSSLDAQRVTMTGKAFIPPGGGNFNRIADNMIPIVAIFTIFVLAPIALSISRMFWKRGSMPRQIVQSTENSQRLERMEQAIESIAIEMERVSEGQRFVTRIMSENRPVGEGQRVAQLLPIPVGEKAAAPRY